MCSCVQGIYKANDDHIHWLLKRKWFNWTLPTCGVTSQKWNRKWMCETMFNQHIENPMHPANNNQKIICKLYLFHWKTSIISDNCTINCRICNNDWEWSWLEDVSHYLIIVNEQTNTTQVNQEIHSAASVQTVLACDIYSSTWTLIEYLNTSYLLTFIWQL